MTPLASVSSFPRLLVAVIVAAVGIYAAWASEAPGGAVVGFVFMSAAVVLGVRSARSRLPGWVGRVALILGVVAAGFAAFLIHGSSIAAPLFAQSADVPAVGQPAVVPQWAAAADRARPMVRGAILDQNLPGVSIAVGTGAGIVWAEGFGWRDVITKTPMTPVTRFNIGSAAQVVGSAAFASLGMANTGVDSSADWSPDHIGEPEEDFPGFTAIHDVILRPLGVSAPRKPLPGDRATFYVPTTFWRDDTTDPRSGRKLMYMRDLACCPGGKAFYSTPSDLVRFGLATNADAVTGELAGGSVMSLLVLRDKGIAVAVASNIAHAGTAALARKVAESFAQGK